MRQCSTPGLHLLCEDCFISPHPVLLGEGWWRAGGTLRPGPVSMRQGRDRSTTHFPRGLDALPDAEETDQPDEKKAESKVPLQRAGAVDSRRQAQHVAPGSKQSRKPVRPSSGQAGFQPQAVCGCVCTGPRPSPGPGVPRWSRETVTALSQSCGGSQPGDEFRLLHRVTLGSTQPGLGQV